MAVCSSSSYTVNKTDVNTDSILINKGALIEDLLDIILIGKRRLEYGEVFNENQLQLLENFSAPEGDPGEPDLSQVRSNLLENPTIGQLWHNETDNRIYYWNDNQWNPLQQLDDVAGNWGRLSHGEQIPRPVSANTGYVFPYEECSWIVSPAFYSDEMDYMECYTDQNGVVTMRFRVPGGGFVNSIVNYQIIGIKDNTNLGDTEPPPSP